MDKLLGTLNDYLASATTILAKYAPQVWDASLQLIRIQSFVYVAVFVFFALVWVGVFFFFKSLISKLPEESSRYFDQVDCNILRWVILCGSGLIWCIVLLANSMSLALGIFAPKLYILYHLAEKAGVL